MDEEWRLSLDAPDYEVSSMGRVRRATPRMGTHVGKIIKHRIERNGYCVVLLTVDGKPKNLRVHRLVVTAFSGPPINSEMQVNHINGIKTDNRLCNLEWCSRSENAKHALMIGIGKVPDNRGHRSSSAKLKLDQVADIRARVAAGEKRYRIAEELGLSRSTIGNIVAGKTWAESMAS